MSNLVLPYVSLFSGGGIGDIGFREAGLTPLVLNEIEPMRAQIAKMNFPESEVVVGDINDNISIIVDTCRQRLKDLKIDELFLLSATPPCQGMSKNGIGTILKAIREGKRPPIDERNYLFHSALKVLEILKPRYFFWENVDRMLNTYILNEDKENVKLVDYMSKQLSSIGYQGDFKLINMADYGLPQNRRRIVGIFQKKSNDKLIPECNLFPEATHAKEPNVLQRNHVTLQKAIGHLPALDSCDKASAKSNFHILHKVPVSRTELYYWIEHTPEGQTAFNNNKCPKCGMISNDKSVYCSECGTLLPKPTVRDKGGNLKIIKGFVSAYKRMKSYEPAPTITTRSAYACSDHNLHPSQNRVLSIYEVAILQGIVPEKFKWGPIKKERNGKTISEDVANDMLLRDVLGEPVPPLLSKLVGQHINKFICQ